MAKKWWWGTPGGLIRTSGVCARCSGVIPKGGGYLCEPMQWVSLSRDPKMKDAYKNTNAWLASSPDLVCEHCFDRHTYAPWRGFLAREKDIVQLVIYLIFFLLVTLIPWLFVLGAKFLSSWCYDSGWRFCGTFFRIFELVIAVAIIISTAWFFIKWLVQVVRVVLGMEDRHDA